MDLSKYSILKIKTPTVSPQKHITPTKIYNLEAIRPIDGKLLRETIQSTSKYIKVDNLFLKINPRYTVRLFNNIKKALSYKLNNITDVSYQTPIQRLQDHYIAMLSNTIFNDHTITSPFQNITTLKTAIENEIDNMKSSKNSTIPENELLNLKQKLHFHQDENLRLSHELSNSQKKYKLIKEQLNEIENEKSQISQKIEDLTDSLSKTKIISNVFDQKDVNSNRNIPNNSERIDLEKEIENIFIKSK